MAEEILPPAKRPCASCPYRKDAPSGVWAAEEYEKLPVFDDPTASLGVFLCHQQNGHLCAGWVGVHDMDSMLGIRVHALRGAFTEETLDAVFDYTTDVPLHESGRAACDHGLDMIADPDEKAVKAVQKLLKTPTPVPRTIGRRP